MKLSKFRGTAFYVLIVFSIVFVNAATAEDAAGKKVFISTKCNTCHSIESQSIQKTMASSKASDLSNVGSAHKADWLTKYLQKEEAKDDKKHVKAWAGTKEDLDVLVKWLETLKTAPK